MRTQISRAFFIGILVVVLLAVAAPVQPVQAAATGGYDLIAAVNALRQSKGVAALTVDGCLMGSAQGHSDYQASIGSWTHSGPGGSTPTSRAVAAGYGGGASVFVAENVAYTAITADLSYILYTVWSDAVHWSTMIGAKYTHAGAGVTVAGNNVYYTLDVGYLSGQPGSNPQPSSASVQVQVQAPTEVPVAPLVTSTPKPDGTVIHVVGFGQTLIEIANAYGLNLDELRQRNNMTGDIIYEGQKLIIQGSSTPTLTATITLTAVPPTFTPRPTRTPTLPPTITPTATATATATPKPFLPSFENIDRQTLGTVILGISGIGLALVLVSFFRKKKA